MGRFLWLIVGVLGIIVSIGVIGYIIPSQGAGSPVDATSPSGVAVPAASLPPQPAVLAGGTPEIPWQPERHSSNTADGRNASGTAARENLERMQIQGIPPPCRDIQKNCDTRGPVAAETYSPTELIDVNTVSAETALWQAERACTGTIGSNISGSRVCCPDTGLKGEPIALYDISGTKLYYRFSSGNGSCSILVRANKLLGTPPVSFRSCPDCLDNLSRRKMTAEKTVQSAHPAYRILSSRVVLYREGREGIRFTLVKTETDTTIQPVLDLCTFSEETQNSSSFLSPVPDTQYTSYFGEYEKELIDWEVANISMRELNGREKEVN